jgi:hypothetical protein
MVVDIRPTFTVTVRLRKLASCRFQVRTLSTLLIDIITLVGVYENSVLPIGMAWNAFGTCELHYLQYKIASWSKYMDELNLLSSS